MRILHVLDRSLPLVAGYTSRSAAILEHQAAMGLEPFAVTSVRHEADVDFAERVGGIVHYRTRRARGPAVARATPIVREALEMMALARRIRRIDVETPFDLLHAHSPILCGIPAHAVARRLGLPSVYEVRAFWEDAADSRAEGGLGSLRYVSTRTAETLLCRSVSAVVTICEGLREELEARGVPRDRIFVVPNGVDTTRFVPSRRDEAIAERLGLGGKTIVAFVGSLFRFEGIGLLLRAISRLAQTNPNLRGLIVGGGPMETELHAEHARLGLGDRVLLTGPLPPSEVAGLYGIADVLCYPRVRHRITETTTPLKPLEAMSAGKTVVASDVGGLRELVRDGDTGFLFRADDETDLVTVLARVVSDTELRRRTGEAARAYVVRERSYRTLTARYQDVYAAAVEHSPRGRVASA